MLAYKDTLKTKTEAVATAQWHQDQDRFIQGKYWDKKSGKGCSVGCMTHEWCAANGNENWYEATEHLFGIPHTLSRLQDKIFEGLPTDKAKLWTVRFMNAVPEGKDLSMVVSKFLYWILTDPDGIIKHARPDGKVSIIRISELFKRKIDGDEPEIGEWRKARDAAAAAADIAAADADAAYAYAAAAYAADAYADIAAAYAADAYAADADVRKKFYEKMADKLIEILEAV